jgi:Short C-terminal domain
MPLLRRRRPLLRAAAVGGGAYALGKHFGGQDAASESGGDDAGDTGASAAAPTSRGLSTEDMQRLTELGKLHDQGVLTDDELAQQKARILGTA